MVKNLNKSRVMSSKHDDKKRRLRKSKSDDSDVDSRGNIRGLIDYSYDSSSDETYTSSDTDITPIGYRTRSKRVSNKSVIRDCLKKEKKRLLKRLAGLGISKDSKPTNNKLKEKEMDKKDDKSNKKDKKVEKKEDKKEENKEKNTIVKRRTSEKVEAPLSKNPPPKRLKKVSRVIESSSESSESEESEESEEDSLDSEEDEEEDDYDESEEEYDEDEDSDYEPEAPQGITFTFGSFDGGENDRMIPKRHDMLKESEDVQKFVKLLTSPSDDNTIDAQIDQFKAMPEDQQKKVLSVLDKRGPAGSNPSQNLMFKILTMNLPTETQSMVLSKYNSLLQLDPGSSEYFKMRNWLEKLTSLPLGIYKDVPVRLADGQELCGNFMQKARQCLDEAIYGQDEAKLQVLQFIGTKIANPTGRGLSLLLAGPPGIGKTSLIKNGIAKALGWPFQFISLGGDSDASTYTGHQLVYESSHCGKIVNSLAAAKSMSMVLMFDEVDKISTTPKGEEVQHLLIHLTDPVQNDDFEDKYLSGIPIDLSRVMFVFSANDLNRIDKTLLDRFTLVQLQGYSQKDKFAIAENYLLPAALKDVDLAEKVSVTKDAMQYILDEYAKEETGVRELKRALESIAQKLNMLRMFNTKDLPFHIKDFTLPFIVKKEHIDLFLKKKKPAMDESALRMYT
jgi:hypothetical protein